VGVKVTRAAVFVAGRYRKLGRNISNSPWLPGKCMTSVSEELARALLPIMRADSYKFNSAGKSQSTSNCPAFL
jgi:tRNA U54 and U55 pseudouridine synthase Pus10